MDAEPHECRTTLREPATRTAIGHATALIRAGGLVAFPTETVYGLGADATSDIAVAGIYAAKVRPSFNPLISHVADLAAAGREGTFAPDARKLAEAFWPGPLTLVVPLAPHGTISALTRAGLDSVALRVPAHRVARALIEAVRRPIAAPSANRSGRISPTRAEHVAADLGGRIDMILDGGPCEVGLESTIVACLHGEMRILRDGGVTREAIAAVSGRAPAIADDGSVVAPGMLAGHYAPRAALRLHARETRDGEAVLDFGGQLRAAAAAAYLDLSAAGDLRQAAANLFRHMRDLDATGVATIAVAPIPARGLGIAIIDRLTRAAAPRGD